VIKNDIYNEYAEGQILDSSDEDESENVIENATESQLQIDNNEDEDIKSNDEVESPKFRSVRRHGYLSGNPSVIKNDIYNEFAEGQILDSSDEEKIENAIEKPDESQHHIDNNEEEGIKSDDDIEYPKFQSVRRHGYLSGNPSVIENDIYNEFADGQIIIDSDEENNDEDSEDSNEAEDTVVESDELTPKYVSQRRHGYLSGGAGNIEDDIFNKYVDSQIIEEDEDDGLENSDEKSENEDASESSAIDDDEEGSSDSIISGYEEDDEVVDKRSNSMQSDTKEKPKRAGFISSLFVGADDIRAPHRLSDYIDMKYSNKNHLTKDRLAKNRKSVANDENLNIPLFCSSSKPEFTNSYYYHVTRSWCDIIRIFQKDFLSILNDINMYIFQFWYKS